MNYPGHCIVNTSSLLIGTYTCLHFIHPSASATFSFVSGFLISTYFLSPDLDLSYSQISKNWGAFKFLWWPYQFFSKHRGLSHAFLLGALIRLFYLVAALFLLETLMLNNFNFTPTRISSFILDQKSTLIPLSLGFLTADSLHLVTDLISTKIRKIFT